MYQNATDEVMKINQFAIEEFCDPTETLTELRAPMTQRTKLDAL